MSAISYTNGASLFTRTIIRSQTCLTRTTCAVQVVQKRQPWQQLRFSSHAPSAPSLLARGQKPVTIQTLQKMYAEKTPITMLTAHNFPSALMAQEAGMDIILVGDSLAMVSLGMADTSEVTLEEMIMSARAVSRAVTRSFTIGDLPMGSYEISPEQALASAIRMVKEGRVQSVKLEGGAEMGPAIKKITTAGIPGNTLDKAMSLLKDARAVEEAGAFAVVLECVPPDIAGEVTNALGIPTIGIGAGNPTSGQVLVQIDMLGVRPPDSFMPKFVKKYGSIWDDGVAAIKQYRDEVTDRSYPGPQHVYKGDAKITEAFRAAIRSSKT
ncbi:cell wall biogenesis and architecture protein [Exophiala dermatitidis]|nr:cell wall biogenesis and architecture protein [Exophiala dermatitidis]KAJ4554469.1 cell wall biogenesis and architecture protein [Exophiala dermatitidis]